MAKVVKWRGQFADIAGTQYTVEIYGDGTTAVTGNNITLGENPLVTNEDDSDDIFTPIRTQTGTLEVIDPDGTLMEQMLPADNLDHPVRVKKGNEIVWQGFLSCEAYTQDYTTRANAVTFNLIGVLEAMKSVQFTDADVTALGYNANIETLVKRALSKVGISNVYMPTSNGLFQRYISTAILYEEQETGYGNGTHSITLAYKSCYDIVESVCTLAGCVCRTSGVNAFICKAKGTDDRGNSYELSSLTFKGTGHTKTIMQGAKSVSVNGSAEKMDASIESPEYDYSRQDTLIQNYESYRGLNWDEDQAIVMYDQDHVNYGDSVQFNIFKTNNCVPYDTPSSLTEDGSSLGGTFTLFNQLSQYNELLTSTAHVWHAGARLSRAACLYKRPTVFENQVISTDSGIHCCFIPVNDNNPTIQIDKPIFRMKSASKIRFNNGVLNFSIGGYTMHFTMSFSNVRGYTVQEKIDTNMKVRYMIKMGDYYLKNGTFSFEFTTTPSTFTFNTSDYENLSILANIQTYGYLEFAIFPYVKKNDNQLSGHDIPVEAFFKRISVSYETKDRIEKDGDSGKYVMYIDGRFGDDISIDTDIVSDRSNGYCKNVIRDADYNQVSTIQVGSTTKRPEIALLNDMADQYGVPRRVLSIEVKPIAAPPPNTVIIEGTRKYIPIDAEHDWRMNRSTLKLLETAY